MAGSGLRAVFRQVWDGVVTRLGAAEEPSPAAPPTQEAGRFSELRRFARRLRDVLKEQGTVTAGAVYFLDLQSLQDHYGARWPDVSVKVNALVSAIIERRLDDCDMYTRPGELTYLLVFGRLGRAQAQAKCAMIAQEVEQRLLGDQADSGHPLLKAAVADLDQDRVGQFSVRDMVEQLLPPHPSAAESRDPSAGPLPDAAPAPRRSRAAPRREETPAEIPTGGIVLEPEPSRVAAVIPLPQAAASQELPYNMRRILAGLKDRREHFSFDQVQFVYRPVWTCQKAVVSSFMCQAALIGREGSIRLGSGVLPDDHDENLLAELDSVAVETLAEALRDTEAAGQRCLLTLTVHYSTVNTVRFRRPYLAILKALVAPRRRRLVIELVDMPDGVPQSRLTELVHYLKPYCRAVILQLRPQRERLDLLQGSGLHAMALCLSHLTYGPELWRQYKSFVSVGQAAGLKTLAHGLRSPEMAGAALAAGFDYLDGDAILPLETAPRDVFHFDWSWKEKGA